MLMSSVPSGLFTVRARALLALALCPVMSLVGCGGGSGSSRERRRTFHQHAAVDLR
jgi:hypothetical protein